MSTLLLVTTGREDQVHVGEERQRRRQADPAVEVAPVPAVPQRETDERDEPQPGKDGTRHHDRAALCDRGHVRARRPRRQVPEDQRRGSERHRDTGADVEKRPSPVAQAAIGVRGDGDGGCPEEPGADQRPGRLLPERASSEHGNESERHCPERDAPEPGREEQVQNASLDDEANARKNRHERRDDRDRSVEGKPGLRKRVCGRERVAHCEQCGGGREQGDEHELTYEPRAIALRTGVIHHYPFSATRVLPIRGVCPNAS